VVIVVEPSVDAIIERITGQAVIRRERLAGGMMGVVEAVTLADGASVVVKRIREAAGHLELEAGMLRHLRAHSGLPVPEVIHADARLLVLERLPGAPLTPAAWEDCAALLAGLHEVTADAYGFETDTVNGTLRLPSPWTRSWTGFYRDHRLLVAAEAARGNGTLPEETHARVLRLTERLDGLLVEPARPSLVHGDVWAANVLAEGARVTGFLDPSACYADAELELAYMAFAGFDRSFFDAYARRRPIAPGFWEGRRAVYQVYPMLLHIYYFPARGGRFLAQLDAALRQVGC
jgi:fructosamine-3-kinase